MLSFFEPKECPKFTELVIGLTSQCLLVISPHGSGAPSQVERAHFGVFNWNWNQHLIVEVWRYSMYLGMSIRTHMYII